MIRMIEQDDMVILSIQSRVGGVIGGYPFPEFPEKSPGIFHDSRRSRKFCRELMQFPVFPDDDLNRRMRSFSMDKDVGYIWQPSVKPRSSPISNMCCPVEVDDIS